MKIFVGLGNPGAKYAGNRHNVGFMAVDRIAADRGFGPWRSKFQGAASEGRLGAEKVLLLKPGTFMNLSGQSVAEAARFHKVTTAEITVFHDELDLALGRLKWKAGGGHAGHNGLRSIHQHLDPGYGRVRIGIGHPGHKDAVSGWVLRDFAKADAEWLDDLLRGISDGAEALAAGDTGGFQNAVALRLAPPRPSTGDRGQAAGRPAAPRSRPASASPSASASSVPAPEGGRDATDATDATGGTAPLRSAVQRLIDRFR